jgi:hypothetical protein
VKAFCLVVASVAFALMGVVPSFAQRLEVRSASCGIGDYRVDVTERVQRLASNGESFGYRVATWDCRRSRFQENS